MHRLLPHRPPLARIQRLVGSIPHGLPTALTFSVAACVLVGSSILAVTALVPGRLHELAQPAFEPPTGVSESGLLTATHTPGAPSSTRAPESRVAGDTSPGTAHQGASVTTSTGASNQSATGTPPVARGVDPSPAPSPAAQPQATPTPEADHGSGYDPTPTPRPTRQPDPTPTPRPTRQPDPTPTPEPTERPDPTASPRPMPHPTPTPEP